MAESIIKNIIKRDNQTLTFTNGFRIYETSYDTARVISVQCKAAGYTMDYGIASNMSNNKIYIRVSNSPDFSGDLDVEIVYV